MQKAQRQRQAPEIVAAHRQNVEGVELDFVVVLPGVQTVEVGDAVNAEQHRLAVNDELALSVLARGLDDPRKALGIVVTAPADQAHAVTVADDHHPVAVVLDLVKPCVGRGNLGAFDRQGKERFGI
jgi:hypothetical protein